MENSQSCLCKRLQKNHRLFRVFKLIPKFSINGILKVFICATALSVVFTGHAQSEFAVLQDLSLIKYSVGGNEQQSSYPKDQFSYLYEGRLLLNRPFSVKNSGYYGNLMCRATDDSVTDPKNLTLSSLHFGFKNNLLDVSAGNVFANFSDYSVNNSLKGVKLEAASGELFKLILTGGVNTANWEDLWEARNANSSLSSTVYGVRYQMPFFSNAFEAGLNYGSADDDRSFYNSSLTYKDRQIVSADLKYKYGNFISLKSEYAESTRKLYSGADGNYATASDRAYKAAVVLNDPKYAFNCDYSRIGPDFETTGGFAAQDLESLQIYNTLFLHRSVSISDYVNLSRDNLENRKETRSNRINPGLNIVWALPLDMEFACGWDFNKEYTDSKTSDNKNETINSSFLKRYKFVNASVGYSKTQTDDYVSSDQGRIKDSAGMNLNGNFSIKKTAVNWSLGEQLSLETKRADDTRDTLLTHSGSFMADFPGALRVEGRVTAMINDYFIDANDCTKYSYDLSINKKIKKWLTVTLNYIQNDSYFSDSANNYFEKKTTGKVSCKF